VKGTRTILAALLIGGLLTACCDAAENESSAPAVVELTPADLSGTANLSTADRLTFTDKCFARVGAVHSVKSRSGNPKSDFCFALVDDAETILNLVDLLTGKRTAGCQFVDLDRTGLAPF
jgi:hypothetical protein